MMVWFIRTLTTLESRRKGVDGMTTAPNLGVDRRRPTTVGAVGNEGDTRERLLQAAIEVIATEGERAIRVRDIAGRAGVTEPSLYHFFGSREGLIIAAQAARFQEEQLEGLRAFIAAVHEADDADDFVAAVRDTLTWAYQPSRKAIRSTRLDVLGSAQSRPGLARQLANAQRVVNGELADVLRFAQRRGWVRTRLDGDVLAAWIIGQISGRAFIEIDPELAGSTEWDEISITAVLAVLGYPPNDNLATRSGTVATT